MDPTKLRLLEAAGEEFADKGFEVATIRAICLRAKANVAAVNYHFHDKEHLYIQAVLEAHRCGMPEPDALEECEGSPSDLLRSYVRNFLQQVLAIDSHDSWHHKLMLREMLRPTEASSTLVREVIRPKFKCLLGILKDACPSATETQLNALGFSIVGQCLHYKIGRPIAERLIGREAFARLDLEFLTEHITNFSLAALGLGPPIGSVEAFAVVGGQRGEK